MLRMHRLLSLWNWLPTFRAVAEQQHISRAAEQLGVSPSAVSRMIGLLEGDVGQPLFSRVGRNIELNDAGAQLLDGVRSAMRMVDESLSAVADTQFVGEVRVAAGEPVTSALLLPAIRQLKQEHPRLVPVVETARRDPAAALLQGDLDVAFVWQASDSPQLTVERIGALALGVFAHPEHPLCNAKRHALSEVAQHEFVLSPLDAAGLGWPREHRRRAACRVMGVGLAAELCASGHGLAVLPEVLVARHLPALRGRLVQLRVVGVGGVEAFAQWRMRLDLPGRAEAVVEAVKAQMAIEVPGERLGERPGEAARQEPKPRKSQARS